ncbi:MAG: 50S ribosomal protein L6 [Anaerolineae bacterium]|jgi:large subunit ribosomal protein L6|nr:50S ribosomal protein L6 [Anaerolineae bacterium]MDX9831689.1 50S ribosomal protein L6 [Anaerolineae bacterium]
MSRIGKQPIPLPQKVEVDIRGSHVTVKGPKGQLERSFDPAMTIKLEDGVLTVERPTDQRQHRATHGLTRALLANMVTGVSDGFSKVLEIEGTGYRAELQGEKLILFLGYSHPIEFPPPQGISFEVPRGGRMVTVMGVDKELVGEIAARIRRQRPPEPYQGKGVRYQGERVRRKAGKSGRAG